MLPRLICAVFVIVGVSPQTGFAAPGSGSASIAPPGDVAAGTSGTWTITYTAAESFRNGTVRVIVPVGWTSPQLSVPPDPGYITAASNEPGGTAAPSISGDTITVAVDTLSAGNELTIVYGDDGGGANPSAVATAATVPGTSVFLTASDPSGTSPTQIATSPSLFVTPAPPFRLDILPADTTVTAGTFTAYRVVVLDEFGNRTPVTVNRDVGVFPTSGSFFLPADHSTPIAGFTIASGEESLRVDYRVTLATTLDPHGIAMFTLDGLSPSLGGTVNVNVVPAAVSDSASTAVASGPVVADGVSQSSVTVTSRDAYGNPRSGDTVVVLVNGDAQVIDPLLLTDVNGEAPKAVTNTTAETTTVVAIVEGVVVQDAALIVFVPGAADGDSSMIVSSSPVTADGLATGMITVTARDTNGNVIAGASVVLFVAPSGFGEVLTQPGGVTDANGDVVGSLTSTITGPRVVTAEVEGVVLSDTVTIVFVPGPVAQFQWMGDGSAVAGVTEQVTLSVFDDRGNLKTDYTGSVSLSTTADSVTWAAPDAFGTINQTGGDTADYVFAAADSGVATLRVTNRVAGSYAVTAQDGPAIETSSPIVVDHAAADRVLLIAGDGQSVEVNTPVSVPAAVRVTDAYGNAVDNEIVTFRVLTGGGTLDAIAAGGIDSTRATDVTGQVQCDLWTMGVTAGVDVNTMRALISSGAAPSVDFTATGVPGPGANLVLTPGTKSVTVGATEVVTASLTDLYNNAVSGERVDVFIKSPASGTLIGNGADPNPTSATSTTSRFGATDALGNVTVVFTASTTAGVSDVLDALSTNVAQSGVADVVYTTTAAGGATNLRITLLSSTAVAGTSFQFVVDAVDGNGNVDPGNAAFVDLTGQAGSGIVFSLTDGGAAVTQVTLSSGSITLYGRGDIAGGWDITASNGGLGPGMSGITITDTGVVASYVATTVGTAVAGTSFDVSVEARDAFGNRVMAAANTIDLAAVDGADSTLVASTSLLTLQAALSAGQAVVSEAYAVAETIRVQITDASANSGFTAAVIITPSMATRVAAESGDSTGVIAGNTQILVARVYDPFNNPVSGVPVTFTPMGGGSVVPATGATDALGRMTTAFTTDVVAGENRVRVTIDDGLPPALEQAEFTVGTIAGPIDYYRVIPARLGIEAGEVIPLDIFAYDINNNLATPDSTTTIDITSDASATFGTSTGTLTGGVFATTMTDTVSGIVTVSVETSGIPSQSGSSSPVTVSHALEYRVASAGGDTTGVTVGSVQLLAVKVSDRYGNDVANALVIFQVDPPGGIDGTAFIRDSVADSTDGITVTDAAGSASARLHTALTAGNNQVKARIGDGSPAVLEEVVFTVSTVAGAIDHYDVVTGVARQTAGVPIVVSVRAFDADDNLVNDSATQVLLTLDPGSGPVWGDALPVTLAAGTLQTTVTVTQTQDLRVRATTSLDPATTGVSGTVTIGPDVPFALIAASATADTITANGLSTTDVTSSVIRDQFSNPVTAGQMVTVTTSLGTIDSPDQDAAPGNQQVVDPAGRIGFRVRSATTPGTDTIAMVSVTGSATGTIDIVLAPVPRVVCDVATVPDRAIVGTTVAFSVDVQNTSSTGILLGTSTTLGFSDGVTAWVANLSSPTSVGGSATATLNFDPVMIDSMMVTTEYQPVLQLSGVDEYGESYTQTCLLPAGSLHISAIEMVGITAPALIIRGLTDTVRVSVRNPGVAPATVTTVNLVFKPETAGQRIYIAGASPDLPMFITTGATGVIRIPLSVDPASPTGIDSIDAFVSADVLGQTATDPSLDPFVFPTIEVQTAATVQYVAGTLSPTTVSRGRAYIFGVDLRNSGAATVVFDTLATILTFNDGSAVFTAMLAQPVALAGNMTQTVLFTLQAIPAAMGGGPWPVTIDVAGMENGIAFATTLGTGADGVMVVDPATIAEAVSNALSPDAVSKQSSVAFLVDFVNSGGATIGLDTSLTTISFDDGSTTYIAQLDPNGPTAITPPGVTLRFQPSGVDNALLVGSYHPMIHLEGSENGLPFQQDVILADSVEVENAPALSLSAWVVDNIVSVGETFVVSAVVTNVAGGADVVPPAELTLDLSGATGYSLPAANPVQTFIVGDTIRWDVRAPSQPSRPDQLSVSISAIPLDENSAQPAALAVGSVQIAVVTEGATIAVRDVSDFLGLDTAVVPGGARDVRKLGFEMTYTVTDPLVADARIDTVAITVLGESGAPLPASAVQGTLRRLFVELGGTQVYEVTAPFTNPVVVAIPGAASERMIPPDGTVTAIVGVDVHNSPPVQEIRLQVRGNGLRIADSGTGQNIAVIDDGTGRPLTGQLVSQPLVILSNRFEEYAHNYPNPFRAGSQSTRIAYFLDSSTSVSIKVYTITGELVYEESIPVGDPRTATGARETPWDGRNTKGEVIRNGVYVCVITAGSKSTKFRIAVAK